MVFFFGEMAISPNISPKSCLGEIFSHISPFWFPLDFQLLLSFPYAISPRFLIWKNLKLFTWCRKNQQNLSFMGKFLGYFQFPPSDFPYILR